MNKIILRSLFERVNFSKSPKKKPESPDNIYEFVSGRVDSDNDAFLNSLDTLTPDDIAPKTIAHRDPRELISECIRRTVMIVSSIVFLVSFGSVINSVIGYIRGNIIYTDISNEFDILSMSADEIESIVGVLSESNESPVTPVINSSAKVEEIGIKQTTQSGVSTYFEKLKIQLSNLSDKYPGLIGWITIDDTNINYPIVQCDNNEYYLSHAPNGEYLPSGSIFLDYRCDKSLLKNHNSVIYGHHMTDTSMFHHLLKFLDEDFFNEHPYVVIKTVDGIMTYEIFSIYETDMYYEYITTDFYSHKDFVKFAYKMKSNSMYQRDVEFTETDRIITLSTCTGKTRAGRYAVHAKLISIEN